MSGSFNRRGFLHRLKGQPTALRPPGSLSELEFEAACTRCGECLPACPESILVAGSGGLPEIDFMRGACSFCGACAASCDAGAIRPVDRWTLRAVVSATCLETQGVTCRACETSCDELALRFRPMTKGRSMVVVDDARCTGCGACVSVCPVAAIGISGPAQTAVPSEEGACHRV